MAYKVFTEMPVWKEAFKLLQRVYEITKKFPSEEKFGMISDMRRSGQSVTNNISEELADMKNLIKVDFIKYREEVVMN